MLTPFLLVVLEVLADGMILAGVGTCAGGPAAHSFLASPDNERGQEGEGGGEEKREEEVVYAFSGLPRRGRNARLLATMTATTLTVA